MAYFIDTTLRDGEQAPGVSFSVSEKLEIAHMLNELGIDELEAGSPAMGKEAQNSIREIVGARFNFKVSCWCRAHTGDILAAAKIRTDCVNLSLPSSDVQIKAMGKSRAIILAEVKHKVKMASELFGHVTMGAQDSTRANRDFLKTFIFTALSNGANRIRISDTVGAKSPLEIMELLRDVLSTFPDLEIDFHGHNDIGMATANAITALQSGARCISATVNGLGERAGNAVLEEVAAWYALNKQGAPLATSMLKPLSSFVAKASQQKMLENKPITGSGAYRHESGIHTAAMLKDVKTYQYLNPRHYGVGEVEFVFGNHAGKTALRSFYSERQLPLSDEELELILLQVKRLSVTQKRTIRHHELLQFYHQAKPSHCVKLFYDGSI